MIKKEDIKIGTLVAHMVPINGKLELRVKKVEKVNVKSFRLCQDWNYIKYEDSKDYHLLTDEEYERLYVNALDDACKKNLKNVNEMIDKLRRLSILLKDIRETSNKINIVCSVSITSPVADVKAAMERLNKELGINE